MKKIIKTFAALFLLFTSFTNLSCGNNTVIDEGGLSFKDFSFNKNICNFPGTIIQEL